MIGGDTPMQVDAIPISTVPTAAALARSSPCAASSFGATLASSMPSSEPAHAPSKFGPDHLGLGPTVARSDSEHSPKLDAAKSGATVRDSTTRDQTKPATNVDSKFISKPSTSSSDSASRDIKANVSNLIAMYAAASEAKPAGGSSNASGLARSVSSLSAAQFAAPAPSALVAPALVVSEKLGISTTAPGPGDSASNLQPLAEQSGTNAGAAMAAPNIASATLPTLSTADGKLVVNAGNARGSAPGVSTPFVSASSLAGVAQDSSLKEVASERGSSKVAGSASFLEPPPEESTAQTDGAAAAPSKAFETNASGSNRADSRESTALRIEAGQQSGDRPADVGGSADGVSGSSLNFAAQASPATAPPAVPASSRSGALRTNEYAESSTIPVAVSRVLPLDHNELTPNAKEAATSVTQQGQTAATTSPDSSSAEPVPLPEQGLASGRSTNSGFNLQPGSSASPELVTTLERAASADRCASVAEAQVASHCSDVMVSSVPVNVGTRQPAAQQSAPAPDFNRRDVSIQSRISNVTMAEPASASTTETEFSTADSPVQDTHSQAVKGDASAVASNLMPPRPVISNLATDSNPAGAMPAVPSAATPATNDMAGNAKVGSGTATAAGDKKSTAVNQPNSVASSDISVPAASSPAAAPGIAAQQATSVAPASGKDSSPTLIASAPPASVPPDQVSSTAVPALPQTHQMLDSAPAPVSTPSMPIAPGVAADLQMNGQMHVGVRTDSFGAVEIHTVVQQSQVGITVHADRDISRWFSSEVPGLESGLNQSHLNLTGVHFDHGRSGVQTATGFSQGQPRQSFSQTPGSQSAGMAGAVSVEEDVSSPSALADTVPSDLPAGSGSNHVSIHV